MSWIRNTTEPAGRRPLDVARLILCGLSVVVVGVWAQSQSTIDLDLFSTINNLAGNMVGLAKGPFALGSPWAALAVVAVLLLLRAPAVALRVGLAAGAALCIADLVNELFGTHSIRVTAVNVRIGDGPVFPVVNVAIITALAVAVSPFAVRALRRLFLFAIVLVSLAAMYLGAGLPSDVVGGILLGLT